MKSDVCWRILESEAGIETAFEGLIPCIGLFRTVNNGIDSKSIESGRRAVHTSIRRLEMYQYF